MTASRWHWVIRGGTVAVILLLVFFIVDDYREQDDTIEIGGTFSMRTPDGRSVTDDDLVGRRAMIFFGFTHCPDVCPATLYDVASWIDELGQKGELIDPYFVTVDPQRDTPERMAEYTGYFSPRITGLIGTDDELSEMAESYRLYYARIELDDGDYTMDHGSAIYLMDSDGQFYDAITGTASFEEAVAKLKRFVADG